MSPGERVRICDAFGPVAFLTLERSLAISGGSGAAVRLSWAVPYARIMRKAELTGNYGRVVTPDSSNTAERASGCIFTGPAKGWSMTVTTSSPEKIKKERIPVINA